MNQNKFENEPVSLSRTIAESPWQQKAFLAIGGLGLAGMANGAMASFVEASKDLHHTAVSHSEHIYTVASQVAIVPSFGAVIGGGIGVIYASKYRNR